VHESRADAEPGIRSFFGAEFEADVFVFRLRRPLKTTHSLNLRRIVL